ncbi:VCBS repeat-containing protein [Streptomyces sp. NPDC127033]|uniref:VCBS repeat-containing protein n=1 Tax=Streptomyces sp. NPDC127033 TaxID=3347110 RepID=UPI00366832C1
MSLQPRLRRRRARLRPLIAAAVATGLAGAVIPLSAVPAAADGADATAATADAAAERTTPAERALKKAAETGKRAEVVAERGEFSTTYANPSGTFTQETHIVPIRVRQNGRLVDADPTLVRAADGAVRPRATSVGLEFSGGGDSVMATIEQHGRTMSLDWQGKLPEPELDGDTATYPEVFPGVDLKLRAGVTGFQQLLVVKSRAAAADPRLERLTFPMETDGVRARTDAAGNLTAVDPAGQNVFAAPTPVMWDSSGVAAGQEPQGAASLGAALATATAGSAAGRTAPRAPAVEDEGFAPAAGAKESAVPAVVEGGALKLTPDQGLLTAPDTVFPVHIDPYVSGGRNNWTSVAKSYPTTSYWNKSDNVARVGHEDDTGGTWFSYFTMDTRNLSGKTIVNSTFRIKNTHSWSCTKKPVYLYASNPISSATTWAKQPTLGALLTTVTDAKGWGTGCPAGNLEFGVKGNAVKAAASNWATMTLSLQASTTDTNGWKKFDASTAVLTTEYNTPPAVPSALDTVPSTKNTAGCGNTAPYGLIGDTDVQLTAKGTDPDGGTVQLKFHLWATGHHPGDDPNGVLIVNQTVSVTSGSVARVTVPKATLKAHVGTANGNFSWKVQAGDGSLTSDWNPTAGAPGCRFVYLPDRPSTPPSVTSQQFPDGTAGWPVDTGTVRTPGTFTVGPGAATDIASYEFWSTIDPAITTRAPGALGGSVTIELTPTKAGAHQLYVRSLDRAGNRSDTRAYLFYANGAKVADKAGDLNGDGHPDLWAVDAAGTLQRYFGDGTGKAVKADRAASAAGRYTDTKTTRRGDWTDDGYEDLITLAGDPAVGRDRLWVHPNDGSAAVDESDKRELRVWEPENDHWQGADQILAIGDVDGPLDLDGDGVIGPDDRPGYPDLLVKQGDQLWLYFGSPSGYLDDYVYYLDDFIDQPPVLIGDGSWSNYDLAAPGDTAGDGRVDLVARKKDTGELFLYAGKGPSGEGLGSGPDRTAIGTGWTPASRPLLTAVPNVLGDGRPAIWSTNAAGDLLFYPDIKGSGAGVGSGMAGFRALN